MGSAELGGGITNTFQACHYLSRLLQCKLPVELSSDLLLTVCIHAAIGQFTVSQYAANKGENPFNCIHLLIFSFKNHKSSKFRMAEKNTFSFDYL